MVHWPDSMATYCPQDRILFSNDVFGQHYASSSRFVDEVGSDIVMREAAKYYANIVLPYGEQVKKVLQKLGPLDISCIAPSHGLIWRRAEDLERILQAYPRWASHQTQPAAVVVFDSMWHSTETMAQAVKDDLESAGIAVELFDLKVSHISDVVASILTSRFVFVGTSIINNQVLPTVGALLTYLKGLRPRERYAFCFGSYGWSRPAFKELEEGLKGSKMIVESEGLYVQFVPEEKSLRQAVGDFVSVVKERVKEEKGE